MTGGQWTFAAIPSGMVKRDPVEAEFFVGDEDSEAVFGRTDGIVREVIQNALDARAGDDPVRVRLAVHRPDTPPEAGEYLDGLRPHLEACGHEFLSDPRPPLHWLVYEDFGTRGLSGDPGRTDDPDPGVGPGRDDFYWFWRNIGRSGKSGQDLGRWGLGKTVLPASSMINTIFGLTIRVADGRRLLMGQAVLKTHRLDGAQRAPEGFYRAPLDAPAHDAAPMPIENPAACDAFGARFGLTRIDEPGLSVVVPYCLPRLEARDLLRSVILHYFVPVLRDRLRVEISGPGLPVTELRRETIRRLAATVDWTGRVTEKKHEPPPFDLAEWAIERQRAGGLHELRPSGVDRAPQWSAAVFPDGLQERLIDAFRLGERLAIRVPLRLEMKDGGTVDSHFDAFLCRDETVDRGEDHYVREGMTISRVRALAGRRGVRGLVLVDDRPLSSLLGDAEGPAHTEWGMGESRPDRQYARWKSRVSFVKLSLAKLAALLTPPPAAVDRDLLGRVFGIDQVEKAGRRGRRDGDSGRSGVAAVGAITPVARWYRLGQIAGGFRLRFVEDVPAPPGARLRIAVAYDLPGGNPLSNWSSFDFDVRRKDCPLVYTGRGVRGRALSGHTLELTVENPRFSFAVRGFDPVRDLYVRVDEIGQPEKDEGGTDDDDGAEATPIVTITAPPPAPPPAPRAAPTPETVP